MPSWIFEQLEGDSPKTLTLADWDAPKGRPGQNPVVSPQTTIRQSEVYYPNNDIPSRFIFGSKQEPFELEGTFRDAFGGSGYAIRMTRFSESFANERKKCRITWISGTIPVVAYIGTIQWFKPSYKSIAHIEWKMSIAVDENLNLQNSADAQPNPAPFADNVAQLQADINAMLSDTRTGKSVTRFPPSLDFGLSDFLNSVTNLIASPLAALNDIANQLSDMSKATMASIKRAEAAVHQVKTAILNLHETFASLRSDASIISNNSSEDIDFFTTQTGVVKACKEITQRLTTMQRDLQRAEQGLIGGMVTAINGDTWESIAARALRDAGRAVDIQRMNGENGPPIPGTTYLIPK